MKSFTRVLGIIGLICLGFGLMVGLYTGAFKNNYYVIVNLGLGAVFTLVSLIANAGDLKSGVAGRTAKAGANSVVYAAAVLAILVMVNFAANRHHKRFDLTENQQYSLSEATIQLVRGMPKEVKVTGFFIGGKAPALEDVLESYRFVNPGKFSWELVDPDKRPELAERYAVRANSTVVVEVGAERKTLTELGATNAEESLTNAILSLMSTGKKLVCSVEGHGERDVADEQTEGGFAAARKALEGENYEIRTIPLATLQGVPADCTIVLIAGPQRMYMEGEAKMLDAYLQKGGSLFAMLEPTVGGPLNDLLAKWGVEVGNDIIVDKVVRMFEGEQLALQPIVTAYDTDHPITKGFKKQTIFTQARSLRRAKGPDGYTSTELAKTSENSWAESKVAELFKTGKVALDAGDRAGPVAVAVAVGPTGTEREGKAKIVVVGDSDFAGNRYIRAFFNGDFFLNAANWLTNQEKQISIRTKGPRSSFVRLTDEQMATVFHLAVLIFPQLLLTIGIVIGWRRR